MQSSPFVKITKSNYSFFFNQNLLTFFIVERMTWKCDYYLCIKLPLRRSLSNLTPFSRARLPRLSTGLFSLTGRSAGRRENDFRRFGGIIWCILGSPRPLSPFQSLASCERRETPTINRNNMDSRYGKRNISNVHARTLTRLKIQRSSHQQSEVRKRHLTHSRY